MGVDVPNFAQEEVWMSPRVRCKDSIGVWAVAALVPLVLTLASYAQCCSSGGCSSRGPEKRSYGGGGGSDTLSTPEPYAGQVFCPVTGEKLGLRGPAVPVQTAIGEKKPSFFGKLTGKKPTPGAVVYVCCPACVAKVQSNPSTYLGDLITPRNFKTYILDFSQCFLSTSGSVFSSFARLGPVGLCLSPCDIVPQPNPTPSPP